jgi:hypothetical protein
MNICDKVRLIAPCEERRSERATAQPPFPSQPIETVSIIDSNVTLPS